PSARLALGRRSGRPIMALSGSPMAWRRLPCWAPARIPSGAVKPNGAAASMAPVSARVAMPFGKQANDGGGAGPERPHTAQSAVRSVRCTALSSRGHAEVKRMGSWVDAQRKAGIAKTIERQRTHPHVEGRMLLSNQRRPQDRVYTLECVDCGAI